MRNFLTVIVVTLYTFLFASLSAIANSTYVPIIVNQDTTTATPTECEYCTPIGNVTAVPSPTATPTWYCNYCVTPVDTATPTPTPTPSITIPNTGIVLTEQHNVINHYFGKVTNTSDRLWSYGLAGQYNASDLWLTNATLKPGESSCYTYHGNVRDTPINVFPNQDVTNHSDYGFTYSNVTIENSNLVLTVTNNSNRNVWGWGIIIALYDESDNLWNCIGYASYNDLESKQRLNSGDSAVISLPLYNNGEYHFIKRYTVQWGD